MVRNVDHVTILPSKSEMENTEERPFCVILITGRWFYSADRSEDGRPRSHWRLDQSAISVDQFYFTIGDHIGSKVFGHRVSIEVKWTFHSSRPPANSSNLRILLKCTLDCKPKDAFFVLLSSCLSFLFFPRKCSFFSFYFSFFLFSFFLCIS